MSTPNIRYVAAGEVCDITTSADGVIIEMFRSGKYVGPREDLEGFRPAKVLKNGQQVWSFQTCGAQAPSFGELIDYADKDGDDYVIVIREKHAVASIVRVNDFAHSAKVMLNGKEVTIGGSSTEALLDVKIAIANELELDYWKSPEETVILQKRTEAARLAHKKLLEDQRTAMEAARVAREERQREILSRSKVDAWSLQGQHFFGHPVNDEEWKCLPKGTYCILMQNGEPVEAFTVTKENSRVSRGRLTEVSAEKPKQKTESQAKRATEAVDQVTVTIRGESRQVFVFQGMSDLKDLQSSGLNSGTWVGIAPIGKQPMTVYAITKDSINTVGQVAKLQSASN